MATSGNTSVNIYDWCSLKFSWWENSQSVANNTTTIGWKLEFITDNGALYVYSKPWEVTIDGKTTTGTSHILVDKNSSTTIASGTSTIAHNDNGSKTFPYSFKVTFNVTLNNGKYMSSYSGAGSGTLDTIARASQPSCITYPDHTQNVGEFGDEISIHMNRKSSEFTHTVRYQFGEQSGTIATGVENGVKWVIPLSLMNLLPAVTSGSGTIYVDTYNGSTKIGTKYCGFTATVPSSVKPSCSFVLEDITGVDDIYGSPVKGLSKIKITVDATQAYSSPIASYAITANGVKYSSSPATTGVLKTAGTSTVKATVTDKRGRSGSVSYDMNVQEYSAPAVTALTVKRCNKDGTLNKRGGYIKVVFSAEVSSMNSKNTALYKLLYKKSSATSYTTVSLTALANKYAVSNYAYIFEASAGSSYDVVISVNDRHNSANPTTKTAKAPTAVSIFSWRGFRTDTTIEEGAGIGKVPEKANTLQVGWDAEFENDVVIQGNSYAFSSPGIASTAGYVLMARLTHKKANADTPITFEFSRRLAPHPMRVHVQFRTDSTTIDPDLKTISYEGSNYGAFIVRVAASVWELYVEKVSAYDTITLNSWFSSKTITDRLTVEFPGTLASSVPSGLDGFYRATPAKLDSLLDHIFPVGRIVFLFNHEDPADYWGGTWERITNAFLWATTSGGTIGQTGGEQEHKLTTAEMPSHSHGSVYSGNASGTKTLPWLSTSVLGTGDKLAYSIVPTGDSVAHNNMPPYIQVSVWRRTA